MCLHQWADCQQHQVPPNKAAIISTRSCDRSERCDENYYIGVCEHGGECKQNGSTGPSYVTAMWNKGLSKQRENGGQMLGRLQMVVGVGVRGGHSIGKHTLRPGTYADSFCLICCEKHLVKDRYNK